MEQKEKQLEKEATGFQNLLLPQKLVSAIADEVVKRLPHMSRPTKKKKKQKNIEQGIFLDTSAIIDGRIFEIVQVGLVGGTIVVLESILQELKHIADSQDFVKRERGRNGLELLEKLKKTKGVKFLVVSENGYKKKEVDEILIAYAKSKKGKIITCDYNLAKKASIQNVMVVNINELSHRLKVKAVPGESLHIQVVHSGKDSSQGVGYLDDGTMIVIEHGSEDIGKTVDVVVSRVLQTASGRILFSKKI